MSEGFSDIMRELRQSLNEDFKVTLPLDSRATLAVWRFGQAGHKLRTPVGYLMRRLHSVLDAIWVRGIVGSELPRSVTLGPGIRLHHAGRQVIIHYTAEIGSGLTMFHGVTIGVNGPGSAPRLGNGVYLGARSTIIGEIVLGDKARVGAGAVVVKNVPANVTVVGVPARQLP